MDQKFIAGIGNIYSDEILWGAGLRWDRMSDALTSEEVRRLYRSMMETLQEAVKHRGSSLADEQYVDLFGRPGEYQHFHNVYAREGLSCPRCRHDIVRERVSGRSTFYLLGLPGLRAVPRRARTMPKRGPSAAAHRRPLATIRGDHHQPSPHPAPTTEPEPPTCS